MADLDPLFSPEHLGFIFHEVLQGDEREAPWYEFYDYIIHHLSRSVNALYFKKRIWTSPSPQPELSSSAQPTDGPNKPNVQRNLFTELRRSTRLTQGQSANSSSYLQVLCN